MLAIEVVEFFRMKCKKQSAQYVAKFVKEKFSLGGPCTAFSTACSSSAVAIIKAAQLIKAGICNAVIAGGVDIASDTALMGFGSLEAVSPQPTNPFSKNRQGITIGEAAAFFLLSREDLDNSGIILAGYGESADAYHITSPDPSGEGAAAAMEKALKNAGLSPADIGYLNLHGTGTKFNDSMEAKAVAAIFGDISVPLSSTKAITGHTLGAAAALELAICWKALYESDKEKNQGELPLHVWDGVYDEELPRLHVVEAKSNKSSALKVCLSNSFAFGGANACLALGGE